MRDDLTTIAVTRLDDAFHYLDFEVDWFPRPYLRAAIVMARRALYDVADALTEVLEEDVQKRFPWRVDLGVVLNAVADASSILALNERTAGLYQLKDAIVRAREALLPGMQQVWIMDNEEEVEEV